MAEYPEPEECKPGDKILILDTASADWMKKGEIYTIEKIGSHGFQLVEDRLGWACKGNSLKHWFILIVPTGEDLIQQLDKLEQKLLKQSNHDTGRKISKSKS